MTTATHTIMDITMMHIRTTGIIMQAIITRGMTIQDILMDTAMLHTRAMVPRLLQRRVMSLLPRSRAGK